MQTFESGGALLIEPGASLASYAVLFGLGLSVLTIPPLVGAYLLLIA